LKLVHENLSPSVNLSAVKAREKTWAAVKVTITAFVNGFAIQWIQILEKSI